MFAYRLAVGAFLFLGAFGVAGTYEPDSVARTLLAGWRLVSDEPPAFLCARGTDAVSDGLHLSPTATEAPRPFTAPPGAARPE